MSKRTIPELRKKFMKVYDKLPEAEKHMVCLVIPYEDDHLRTDEPCSWSVCRIEIRYKTKLGRQMLKMLDRLRII